MLPTRCVVISLRSQPARLAGFLDRWAQATDGAPVDVMAGVDIPHNPTAGCYASHLAVLDAYADTEALFVLEDDAAFTTAFTLDQPTPPPDWWLLRPGAHAAAPPPPNPLVMIGQALVGAPYTDYGLWRDAPFIFRTHAYITRRPAELAAGLRARGGAPNVSTRMAMGWPGHYRAWPPTVVQTTDAQQ